MLYRYNTIHVGAPLALPGGGQKVGAPIGRMAAPARKDARVRSGAQLERARAPGPAGPVAPPTPEWWPRRAKAHWHCGSTEAS
jgi:hypothetical protein